MFDKDEIIKMARQAGAVPIGFNKTTMQKEYSIFFNELETFAKLVAAKELRELGQIIFDYAGRDGLTLEEEALLKHLYEILQARGEA